MAGRWKTFWVAAQITPVLVSSFCWLVLGAVWPLLPLAGLLFGVLFVAGGATRAGLWWRFGVRPASPLESRLVLAGIVPMAQLRGRRQPRVWVSRRANVQVVMPSGADLVLGERLTATVVAGRVGARQLSALVSHALGLQPVHSSRLVAAVDAYCLPWLLIELVAGVVVPVTRRIPLGSFAWRLRWLVFGLAVVDAVRGGRWYAVVGVVILAVLSWSTGFLRRRWQARMVQLGDGQVRADKLGPVLAGMIRSQSHQLADLERADSLAGGGTAR